MVVIWSDICTVYKRAEARFSCLCLMFNTWKLRKESTEITLKSNDVERRLSLSVDVKRISFHEALTGNKKKKIWASTWKGNLSEHHRKKKIVSLPWASMWKENVSSMEPVTEGRVRVARSRRPGWSANAAEFVVVLSVLGDNDVCVCIAEWLITWPWEVTTCLYLCIYRVTVNRFCVSWCLGVFWGCDKP